MLDIDYGFTINAANEFFPRVAITGRDVQVLYIAELLAEVEGSSATLDAFQSNMEVLVNETDWLEVVEWRDGAWQVLEAFERLEARVREQVEGAE